MSSAPHSTKDLDVSERRFLAVINQLGFGRLESVVIEKGRLVLDPWPLTVRAMKFGAEPGTRATTAAHEFELSRLLVEFFEYVRSVDAAVISRLEIRHSLPYSLEVVLRPEGGERA